MKFKLSSHAEKRIQQRQIKLEWIADAIENPDTIEFDAEDPLLLHALKAIPEKGLGKLRVIYNEATNPWTIVTAFFE
jgi:hypothetical protein